MRRISAPLVLVLAAALTIPALLVATADAASSAAPKAGKCYRYDFKAWSKKSAPSAAPISCKAKHQALTAAVGTFAKGTTFAKSQDRGTTAWNPVYRACIASRAKILGGSDANRARTAYALTYFSPTKTQWAHGARWYRCDVTLRAESPKTGAVRLLDVPIVKPYLANGLSRTELRCLDFEVSDLAGFSCSSGKIGWEITGTYKVPGSAFPSNAKFNAIATEQCERIVGSNEWYATWPGKIGWGLGERTLGCYERTLF